MRPTVLTAFLLVFSVAGCFGGGDGDDGDGAWGGPIGVTGYFLDCSIAAAYPGTDGLWAEPCLAHASPNDAEAKTEIDLVVNPTDPLNVFVASKDLDLHASDCVWSVGQVSFDGGHSWNTTFVGGDRFARQDPMHPLFGWDCTTDPIMAWAEDGTLYYYLQTYMLDDDASELTESLTGTEFGTGSTFYVAVSHDGGLTWPEAEIELLAVGDGTLVFHDYPRMLVNPATGTVSGVWNAIGLLSVNAYSVSVRDGAPSPPTVVAHPEGPLTTAFASGFAAASDGTVYMTVDVFDPAAFLPVGGGPVQHMIAVSTDDAQSFTTFYALPEIHDIDCPLPGTATRCGTGQELAVDNSGGPHDGRVYVMWPDAADDGGDIMVSWSDDGGATWADPATANGAPSEQFMPRMGVDSRGHVHILHLDRQFHGTWFDATWTFSTDGGETWHHQRLTQHSFDPDLGIHQEGFPFIGDYNGIGAAGDFVYFAFPTTHTGRAEIAVAHAHWAP
jgi:hypothetical protein